jgi:hypothetical protein
MYGNGSNTVVMGSIVSLLSLIGMLLLELVLTMLIYSGLNYYSLNLFGGLVGFAGSVLETLRWLIGKFIPGMANIANATLFGELGPKAILLLLIGLVVAALLRGLTGLIRRH